MPLFSCKNLSLRVPLGNAGPTEEQSKLLIDDVSLDIDAGSRVGFLGGNGAGKTTLMKLLSGRLFPTSGRVIYPKKMRAVFSSNFGMQPKASGAENIYLQCLAMGLSLGQIEIRVPDIIAFTDLGDYINQPVQTYSSGMRLRLSVAITLSCVENTLVLDEWFGAGDRAFEKKLTRRLGQVLDETGTLLTSSHNMNLLRQMCDLGVVLEDGVVRFYGPIDEAIAVHRGGR